MMKRAIFLFLILLPIFVGGFFITQYAKAGIADNLSGWAWSDMPDGSDEVKNPGGGTVGRGAGWISLNSTNCDADGNGFSDGLPGCPPLGASVADYGVRVQNCGTGGNAANICDLRGYAWSDRIGWISFQPGEVAGCPSAPCMPKFNRTNGQVSGWARACSVFQSGCNGALNPNRGGWDGWIHLRRDPTYGVTVSGCNWEGWAWGSDIGGWIEFRNVTGTGDACTVSIPSLTCFPPTQSVNVSEGAFFTASGGSGIISWSAPGGIPPAGGNSLSFSTHYTTPGTYTVTVTRGLVESDSCEVTAQSDAPLLVSLTANPPVGDLKLISPGPPPQLEFKSVLTATVLLVPPDSSGDFTYQFDCDGDGTWDHTNTLADFTYVYECLYDESDIYTAVARVSRAIGADPGQATTTLIVKPPLPGYKEVPPQ